MDLGLGGLAMGRAKSGSANGTGSTSGDRWCGEGADAAARAAGSG